jgi:hypothetical protein
MKPKLKNYLIGYSHDVKSKYMWQNSDNKTDSILIEQYDQPNITEALQAVKAHRHNIKFTNLQIVGITDMGLARSEMPDKDKDLINTINNFTMKPNELGTENLENTIVGGVELGFVLGDAFGDGFQLGEDALTIISQAGNIEKLYKEAPAAWEELKDLTPEEAEAAMTRIAERLNAEPGTIKDVIRQSISLITRTYTLASDVVAFAKQFKKAA